jgi:hypothetical protein
MSEEKPLINPIEEYFKNNSDKENNFIELFEANNENVDLRTDLSIQEIVIINKLIIIDNFIKEKVKSNIYDNFINHYLRLKISKDRLSRAEFVDINRRDRFKKNLEEFGNFKAISEVKK